MQWTLDPETELTKKRRAYYEDNFFFAWRPVVAYTKDGSKKLVWWELVRRERRAEMRGDGYGGSCRYVYYVYRVLEHNELPTQFKQKVKT